MDTNNHNAAKVAAIGAVDAPISNPNGVRATYSNHFGVSATAADLTLYFMEVGQAPTEGGGMSPRQEVKSIVTIPALMANGIVQALHDALGLQQAREMAVKQMEEKVSGGEK